MWPIGQWSSLGTMRSQVQVLAEAKALLLLSPFKWHHLTCTKLKKEKKTFEMFSLK